MKTALQAAAVLVLLALGGLGAWALVAAGDEPVTESSPPPPPLVEVLRLRAENVEVRVRAQGTVRPRTEGRLVAEVSGRVGWASPSLAAGGWFGRGEPLLKLDERDFELAVVRREAAVAQARLRLEQVRADAAIARREWEELGRGEATPLALREPQLAEAEAALAAAGADLEAARRDLERATLRAPYDGRVREESVDVGQFVSRGQALASIYAIDRAEVRVPLPDEELAFLDLPLGFEAARGRRGPEVLLRARFAGVERAWRGRLVRTEGELDPRTRMVGAVVEVEDPQGRRAPAGADTVPLAIGLFVDVEILGRTLEGVHVVPRSAFHDASTVLVADPDDRLRLRSVEVARTGRESALVTKGLADGERVVVTPLDAFTEGMKLRTRELAEPEGAPGEQRLGS